MKKATCFFLLLLIFFSCSDSRKKYVIGVSQCSEDIWREKQNAELRMGAYLHDDVDLRFVSAYDSDERQVQQIDSLVATGIDLLIVAPNQVATISTAIDRAYDSGIPIIVFERKTNSKRFTAFISADNYEMGRLMGQFICRKLNGKGKILEIMGLKGSSPAIERHKGFSDAIKEYPGVSLVATLQGDWTEESGYAAVNRYEKDLQQVDFVFGQNDRMAMGARKALLERMPNNSIRYCGIDGLSGENGGIRLVRDGILEATYIYPTHGDRLLEVAIDILEGKSYEKETRLKSALVTKENANVLLLQNEEIERQSSYLDRLNAMADQYLQALGLQRTITWLACGVIVLLLLVIFLLYLYQRGKISIRRERVVNNLWNMKAPAVKNAPQADASQQPSSYFISRFKEVVDARLAESELSIEDLAADMNLSRVQLYRKVKSISNSSPVELLRKARLQRGYQLLLTTDKTISEVAYAVGFTAPSYFSKCFKEEFGFLPGEVRKPEDNTI